MISLDTPSVQGRPADDQPGGLPRPRLDARHAQGRHHARRCHEPARTRHPRRGLRRRDAVRRRSRASRTARCTSSTARSAGRRGRRPTPSWSTTRSSRTSTSSTSRTRGRRSLVNELDLLDPSTQNGTLEGTAFGGGIFLHDMVVKEIDGKQIMLVSYWDGGYAQLDVTDPTERDDHRASRTSRRRILSSRPSRHRRATPIRPSSRATTSSSWGPTRTSGRSADALTTSVGGFNFAEPVDATVNIATLPGGELSPSRSCSSAALATSRARRCPDTVPAAPAAIDADPDTLRVAVIERGLCFFDEKVQAVEDAGWDAFVVFNNAPPARRRPAADERQHRRRRACRASRSCLAAT